MLARTGNLVKDMKNDFRNYAVNHLGMSSNTLDSYARHMEKTAGGVMVPTSDYMNPYILEERQLNVTQMDVFSRLMMDRIIFLGTQVSDQSANIIQAQLLYLDSVDPEKDIALYINSPEDPYMPVLAFMTPCSISVLMSRLSAPVWRLQWLLFCLLLENMGNATHFLIHEL